MTCPRCRLESPPEALRCDCGYDFASGVVKESYLLKHERDRAAASALSRKWAGFLPRLGALVLDFLVLFSLFMMVAIANGFIGDPLGAVERMRPALESGWGLAFGTLYFAAFEASPWRGTPGKRLLKLTVQDSDAARIGLGRAIWRNLAKDISGFLFPVSIALVLFSRERRCLHDYLAGTWVSRPVRL